MKVIKPTFTFNPSGVPAELKLNSRWVVWALIQDKENEKPVKTPVTVNANGQVIKSNGQNERYQYSFEYALNIYNRYPGVIAGLGYVLSKDDPYVFIDLDNIVDDDVRLEYVNGIDTWMEHSQSGRGLHILVKGAIDKSYNSCGIELYGHARFIAFTGDRIENKSDAIADGRALLAKLVTVCKNNDDAGLGRYETGGAYVLPDLVEEGNRNNTMYAYIGSLVKRGYTLDDITRMSLEANEERFEPPMDPDEIHKMITRQLSSRSEEEEREYDYVRSNYIYIAEEGRWYDVEHDAVISDESMDKQWIGRGFTGARGERAKLSRWLSRQPGVLQCDAIGWRPWKYGDKHHHIIYTDGLSGKRYVNRFLGYSLEPAYGDVTPWLSLLEHLIPREEYRQRVLEWLAFMVQHPDVKCEWQLVIAGIEGAGKDSLLKPFNRIFGSAMKSGGNNDITGAYDDILACTKLLVFNEARNIRGDALERLKRISASEGTTEFVANIKGKAKVVMENLWSVVINTNNLDAIGVSENDRRFYVIFCDEVMPDALRITYYKWLEDGGSKWLFKFLLDLDIVGTFNPWVFPGKTEFATRMYEYTRSDFDMTFDDYIESYEGDLILPNMLHSHLLGRGVNCSINQVNMKLDKCKEFEKYPSTFRIQKKINGKVHFGSREWRYRVGSMWDVNNNPRQSDVYDFTIEMLMLAGSAGRNSSKF